MQDVDYGFYAEWTVPILNPPIAHQVTGSTAPTTQRHMRNAWYMPFSRRLDMEYPSGIRHIIFNCATPMDDGRIKLVQCLYRNDTDADCPTAKLTGWGAVITVQDQDSLESTDIGREH